MVGDCQTIRQLAIAHGMQEERIVTFPWGIDLEHFVPLSSALSASEGENVGNLGDYRQRSCQITQFPMRLS